MQLELVNTLNSSSENKDGVFLSEVLRYCGKMLKVEEKKVRGTKLSGLMFPFADEG